MLEKCRFCGHTEIWKAGIVRGKQRYKCKQCKKTQIEVDSRVKYSAEEQKNAITLYLEGNGFRRIARIMGKIFGKLYRHQTIQHWIKKAGLKALNKMEEQKHEPMDVVEMDELYTFVKKRP